MVVEQGSRIAPALGLGAVARRHGVTLAIVIILLGSLAAVAALVLARLGGADTFVTAPLSAIALAGSAGGIAVLASRRFALRDARGGMWLLGVAVAVAGYLALGAVATATASALATSLWSVWWAVPLVLIQLSALDSSTVSSRWTIAFGALAATVVALGAVFARPTAPFVGIATIAPEGWPATSLLDALTTVLFASTIAVPVALPVKTLRGDRRARTSSLIVVAAAAVPPLLIIVCYGLAVARDPGAVEPEVGSVAYLVALSLGCMLAASCLAFVRPTATAQVISRLLGAVLAGYGIVLVSLAATSLGSLLHDTGPLVSGMAVAALATVVAFGWWRILRMIAAWVEIREEPTASARLAILSAREREVLELLADGVRDADIAARLHLSPRTVESHLTRIFAKLGLESADGRNRRVLAVRAWSQAETGS